MKHILSAAFIFLASAMCFSQTSTELNGSSTQTATFVLVGSHTFLDVKVNGKGPYRFLLDTGASDTSIDSALARELKLPVLGKNSIGDPQNPTAIEAEDVKIASLEAGAIRIANAKALSYDLSKIFPDGEVRGVLGMPEFADRLLTIDYPRSLISVSKGELPAVNGKDVIGYELLDGNFEITVSVNGKPQKILFDTGASGGFVFPKKLASEFALSSELKVVGKGRTVNNTFSVYGSTPVSYTHL
ncbi:MAG: aspartyl protease family protein, partial [Pyrinomonadaceae bacterium]|nr:aspartyl protease family protein [Pyrinomonadaceae bacterium]